MLRKPFIVALGCVIVGAALAAGGFRIERGGSGWPRFITRSNEAALEAVRKLPAIGSAKVIHLPSAGQLPSWLQG